MKTLATFVVALVIGLFTVGCMTSYGTASVARNAVVTTATLPSEADGNANKAKQSSGDVQKSFPYDEVFTAYLKAGREKLVERFGEPEIEAQDKEDLVLVWKLFVKNPGVKDVYAMLTVTFEIKDNQVSRLPKRLSVMFGSGLTDEYLIPLGSNCSTLINLLHDRKLYAQGESRGTEEYFILGKFDGFDVAVKGYSSVWPFDLDKSGNLKPNPGFDWKVGYIQGFTIGPRPCKSLSEIIFGVDEPIKAGLYKPVVGG